MKMHLGSIGDYAQISIDVEHVDPTSAPTTEDLKKKKDRNQAIVGDFLCSQLC